ncbi:MAG: choice-of-anchor L domain-containing protein [Cypionkella sp.]
MAIANELTINTAATAVDMANAIFGNGVSVQSATFQGAAAASGIYSGALSTIAGISPTDSGVILSTGRVIDFTNSSGTTNTNVAANTSTDHAANSGAVDGDAQLTALAGVNTFDGAILNVSFIPDGDYLTLQFVFSSEEYPEYVNGNINDSFGVWVNGTFVPVSVTTAGNVAIDSINASANRNLYIDNTADQYNTEMDGFTRVL